MVLRGPYGHHHAEAIIDTGFSGAVGVPREVARRLGLLRRGIKQLRGPDGIVRTTPCYSVEVAWVDGALRTEALETGIEEVLIGADLLRGRTLVINYGPEQSVEIR